MADGMNKPAIRFAGFTDAWEQRKLGELSSLITKGTTPLDKNNSGIVNFVKIESIDESSGDITITQRISIDEHNGYLRRSQLKENDILFSIAGTLGRVTSVKSSILPANTNQALAIIRLKEGCLDYVKTYLKGKAVAEFIKKNPTIGAQPNLSLEQVANLEIAIPSVSEQVKIGNYFEKLDNLITLHQREYAKIVNIKASMLEKMFPKDGSAYPEVRFAGFTDAWEQRKLGEVATFINGRAYSQPELLSSGKYKVLRVGNFYTNDSWYYSDLELGEKYYADYGDLLYTWSATFGPHIWFGDRVIYHYHIWKINLSDQLEKQFAVQLLEQDRANILSSKNGSTMVHITKEGMEQKDVIIPPSTKEQQEIGAFFLQLDNLITLHQRKLEKLQNIKKSMLEKMFV